MSCPSLPVLDPLRSVTELGLVQMLPGRWRVAKPSEESEPPDGLSVNMKLPSRVIVMFSEVV